MEWHETWEFLGLKVGPGKESLELEVVILKWAKVPYSEMKVERHQRGTSSEEGAGWPRRGCKSEITGAWARHVGLRVWYGEQIVLTGMQQAREKVHALRSFTVHPFLAQGCSES